MSFLVIKIENEYGSYFACDRDYMHFLRDKVISILGSDVVIYTTDGSEDAYVKCGKIDGVYATVDFGPGCKYSKNKLEEGRLEEDFSFIFTGS